MITLNGTALKRDAVFANMTQSWLRVRRMEREGLTSFQREQGFDANDLRECIDFNRSEATRCSRIVRLMDSGYTGELPAELAPSND